MDGSRDYLIRQLLDSSDGCGSAGNGDTVDPTPLQAALRYRDLGLNVVPIALGTKAPPKGFQWSVHQNKPMTEHEIRACWGERRSAGVALVTGGVSGVVGLDIDLRNHNKVADVALTESILKAACNAPLSVTPNGFHLLFSSHGQTFRNKDLCDGVELKGEGGLLVMPPSRHKSGGYYRWRTSPEWPLPAIPELVTELIKISGATTPIRPVVYSSCLNNRSINNGTYGSSLHQFACRRETVDALMALAGRRPGPPGQAFYCILPGHDESKPSAAWHVASDGSFLYHDFHKRSGEGWFTIGEVYHSLMVGQVAELRRVHSAQWLARFALGLGYTTPLSIKQSNRLTELRVYLPNDLDGNVYKVFDAIAKHTIIEAMSEFDEVKASTRFLADMTGLAIPIVNRSVNLLCCLGVLDKVPGSSSRGDRYMLGVTQGVRQRWEYLGRPDLMHLNGTLVERTLGKDVASRVFRRSTPG